MTTIGLILIWLAVLVLGAAVIDQRKAFAKLEEIEMRSISSLATIKQDMDKRMDGFVSIHNASVDHYDSEIDQIIARMDQITADIAELNKEHQQDRRDLVDIRQRYILYREPKHPNGGVEWAKDIRCSEDL